MAEAHELTMVAQAAAMRRGELSPVELATHYLARIEELNDAVGAYLTVTADHALADARRAERRLKEGGELPPLLGVPMAVKDLTPVKGVRFTAGSSVFAEQVAEVDAYIVTLLRERGGSVLLGKTNTPEFGLPAYTENRLGPPARTPYDLTRGAGGSSGGAAAAVAAG
ncbi:amidase family protein, partial [Actinacidiphila soli]|uniref:amidase family protein n=1 Tax=Actinacidiphila soli TaxID=2487275 RepID=UPI0013E30E13